jgi:hypothetical protein
MNARYYLSSITILFLIGCAAQRANLSEEPDCPHLIFEHSNGL